jgi:hypothetical protein
VVRLQRGLDTQATHWRRLRADRPLAEIAAEARGLVEEERS